MLSLLFRLVRSGSLPAALLVLVLAGCGSSASSPSESTSETPAADQEKIRELSKKGYNFREIRSIMKGETPEPGAGKKAGRGGR